MTDARIAHFRAAVLGYYRQSGRHDLPWRLPAADGSFDPYAIMVSELMLQQTQVQRVVPKYQEFLARFPSVNDLASASLADVLVAWQGLGYNRRAKYLWQAAGVVAARPNGEFPRDAAGLAVLPGVGVNTAGAILAYAYDAPVTFVETNVRTVFIHHFFKDESGISDKQLLPLVQAALPPAPVVGDNRLWYWAVMDYGSYIKRTVGNLSRASSAYTRQSAFKGSRRAVRGAVLRALAGGPLRYDQLVGLVSDPRLPEVLDDLGKEQLVSRQGDSVALYTG